MDNIRMPSDSEKYFSLRNNLDYRLYMKITKGLNLIFKDKCAPLQRGIINSFAFLRKQKISTRIFGRLNKQNHKRIEIDITYECNLKCFNCSRSCRQAPTGAQMSVSQIRKFIFESVEQKRNWELIQLLGGEPTIHPDIFEIVDLLMKYKKDHSPLTRLGIVSNGFGPKVEEVLSKLPPEFIVTNTGKKSIVNKFHYVNIAPADVWFYKFADFTNACPCIVYDGISLNMYGYYPCGVGGGIDRVFGFNIGKKKLPLPDDAMVDQLHTVCRYCGHFFWHILEYTTQERISPSWKKAYVKALENEKKLILY